MSYAEVIQMTNNNTIAAFEVGKSYGYDFPYTILKRTEKTVVIQYEIRANKTTKTETKKVFTNEEGVELIREAEFCICRADMIYMTEEEKEAQYRAEEEARLEAERKERHDVEVSEKTNDDAPIVDDSVIMAWCMQEDIRNLVENAMSIRMVCTGICANPEMNSTSYGLKFNRKDGMYVIISVGMKDTHVHSFCNNNIAGEPCILKNGQRSWKIEPTFDRRFMTVDKDGVWSDPKTGEVWNPTY